VSDARDFGTVDRDTRLSDRVATQMLETIRARDLKPGDRLPTERELAEQFGVSRTVIREAVRSLVGKGVIEARAGRGLSVAAVGGSMVWESMSLMLGHTGSVDYRKVHEVRSLLEVEVARLAAERADDLELGVMATELEQMHDVLTDLDAASIADLEFHRALARATHNELFVVMLEAIQDPMLEIRRTTFALPGRAQSAYDQHLDILEQVERRDPVAAGAAMSRHLVDVESVWEGLAGQTPLPS
jgi:GntR family transcriptional regulator, transcriptional repressor for pyruvate dehydrogenase complex